VKHSYVAKGIDRHPIVGDPTMSGEALKEMQEKTAELWPDCKWAAAQCMDLGSRNVGDLRFFAVGPQNSVKEITSQTIGHWSYYWVGWVDLKTGKVVADVPTE